MIILLAAASFLNTPIAGLNAKSGLGNATRQNLAAMIVPPAPHGPAIEGTDGTLAVAALRRLYTDKVKRPSRNAFSTLGGGGGSE